MENKNTAKTTSPHPLPHPSTPAGANDAADNNNYDNDNQAKDTSIEQKPPSSHE